jgi:hypothetical protein
MAQLSEWLQLMLAEIARRQEEAQRVSEEDEQRRAPMPPSPTPAPAAIPINATLTGAP